ncbi:threonine/serine exporter ThrE family protein [Pseudonocardia sp. N23]|uniref:threonine/serine ThrE exporter family protein n=1 Tax=Pseudonocardia sp. N23 TaxID=1987376 RepID=UPI000BFC0793|nr:threonine/serine exporter family protein [Pseudonocardia sp. N23]GAY08724.1 possible amino acid export carrier protein [Pseudonocardia sp. N23]
MVGSHDGAADRLTRRLRGALRRDARRLLSAGPPTVPMLEVGPKVPDDARVQEVLDLCMRVGEVLLSSGESVDEVTETMLRLARVGGLSAVEVDITFTSVTMCCHRGKVAAPVTSMRLVRYRSLDLTRLAAVRQLVAEVEAGNADVRTAAKALSAVTSAPHPYPRWVATAGWALLAGTLAILLGGAPVTAALAFVVTALIDRTGRLLSRWGLPTFFLQVVGGLFATLSTVGLLAAGVFPDGARPSLVVAAGITVLLSGLSVVSTVQDAITGYYVTAAGRGVEIALLSAGLLTGVVIGLKLGFEVGVALEVSGDVSVSVGRFWLSLLLGAVAAAAYALAGYAPLRTLPLAGVAGAAGWGMYWLLSQVADTGPIAATGIAAVVIGVFSGVLKRTTKVPTLVVTLAGITPLLPGLTAYRGFYQLAVQGVAEGLVTVTLALAIGLALAAGVALGEFVVRPRTREPVPAVTNDAPDAEPQ